MNTYNRHLLELNYVIIIIVSSSSIIVIKKNHINCFSPCYCSTHVILMNSYVNSNENFLKMLIFYFMYLFYLSFKQVPKPFLWLDCSRKKWI